MRRDDTPVIPADAADALAEWLQGKLPDWKLYENDLPRNFVRPCMFLELIRSASMPYSTTSTRESALLTVTLFPMRDEFGDMDRTAARETAGTLVRGLSGGLMMARDRALRIRSVSAVPDSDRVFLDVQLEWFEGREKSGETAEMMKKVNIDLRKGGDR